MENVIYRGEGGAACASIRVEGPVPQDVVDAIRESSDVINVKVVEL